MAKTKFINGTVILSKWLNSIFGGGAKDLWTASTAYAAGDLVEITGGYLLRCVAAGTSGSTEPTVPGGLRQTVVDNTVTWELFAGHLHDGNNFNGSAPKIDLTNAREITGILPYANQESAPAIYVEDNFSLVFPDTVFTSQQTVNCRYRKWLAGGAGEPDIIHLFIKNFAATSNSNTLSTSSYLPEDICPVVGTECPCSVIDDSSYRIGSVVISAGGGMVFNIGKINAQSQLYGDPSSFQYGAGIMKGLTEQVFTYYSRVAP